MTAIYYEKNKESEEQSSAFDQELSEVEKKIRRLEERYVLEEIDRDIFTRFRDQFQAEKRQIAENASRNKNGVSNLEKCLKLTLQYSRKLASTWAFGDYEEKQTLQKILFPRGISYNRESDKCRTSSVNNIFILLYKLSGSYDEKKVREATFKSDSAHWVEPLGVEPRSKQVHCKLSTCLFRLLISECRREPDGPTSFLHH